MTKGLYSKYVVFRKDGEPAEGVFFVLKPEKDLHARVAVKAYADACKGDDPKLAKDLYDLLDLISPSLFEREDED